MTQARAQPKEVEINEKYLKQLHKDAKLSDFHDGRLLPKDVIDQLKKKFEEVGEVGNARYHKDYLKNVLGIDIGRAGIIRMHDATSDTYKLYAVYKGIPAKEGGFGKVKLLQDLETGEFKALKVLHNVKGLNDFKKECKNLEILERGVGQVLRKKVGPNEYKNDRYCIIQDLIPGKDLFEVLKEGKLNTAERLNILLQTFQLTQKLHEKGYLHRDIKPENFMYDAETKKVEIIDFGFLLKKKGDKPVRDGHRIVGTEGYMSPEALKGTYSTGTDVFALGRLIEDIIPGGTQGLSNAESNVLRNLALGMTSPTNSARTSLAKPGGAIEQLAALQVEHENRITLREPFKHLNNAHSKKDLVQIEGIIKDQTKVSVPIQWRQTDALQAQLNELGLKKNIDYKIETPFGRNVLIIQNNQLEAFIQKIHPQQKQEEAPLSQSVQKDPLSIIQEVSELSRNSANRQSTVSQATIQVRAASSSFIADNSDQTLAPLPPLPPNRPINFQSNISTISHDLGTRFSQTSDFPKASTYSVKELQQSIFRMENGWSPAEIETPSRGKIASMAPNSCEAAFTQTGTKVKVEIFKDRVSITNDNEAAFEAALKAFELKFPGVPPKITPPANNEASRELWVKVLEKAGHKADDCLPLKATQPDQDKVITAAASLRASAG